MCPALGAAGQGHCVWRRRGPSARDLGDAGPARLIPEACESSRGIYGAPKVHMELLRRGVRTSRKRVARLMRDNGRPGTTRGCARRPKGTPKAAAPQAGAAPDLVGRDFTADGPDKARFADITYVRTRRGWPCPALVMDIWPGRAVGWSMSDRMDAGPADDALKTAIARRRPPAGCTRHSDHGSRYASLRLGRTMRENGIRPSTGAISPPWDDAAMESPMGPVKAERARAHRREPRAGGAGDIRVHRVPLRPGADALRARLPQPRGVRGEEPERRRRRGVRKCKWNRGRFRFKSTIRRDMPSGLVEAVDRMDAAGRRQTLRSISRAAEASGFEAACGAALRVVEGGRAPDDATVDVLARRIAAGGAEAEGGADLGVYDGFLRGGARHAG